MVAPINYLAMMPQQETFESLRGAVELGLQIRAARDQRAQREQEAAARAQYEADLQAAMAAPTAEAFAGLAMRYPQHREAYKQAWDGLSAERQQNELRDASELAAALQGDRQDVALTRLDERIEAMKSAGQDTSRLQRLRDAVAADPQQALGQVLAVVSGLPGGDKLLGNLAAVGQEMRAREKAPAELRAAEAGAVKAEADAKTAGVTAKFAESQAIADLEQKGWNIKVLQADIDYKKQSSRIQALQASIAKEGNDLRRRELQMKLDEAVSARESKVREKVVEAETGAASIDNMLNTIERIKLNPRLNDVLGGIEGRLPAVRDASVDAIALIDTLGSQAFLSQIPNIKGMGALSNAEGEKLQQAFQNFGRTQSEKQFRSTLEEASRLLMKARENISLRTGVPLSKPDTPAKPEEPTGGVTVSGW